jgi:hypothetical protein
MVQTSCLAKGWVSLENPIPPFALHWTCRESQQKGGSKKPPLDSAQFWGKKHPKNTQEGETIREWFIP